MKTSPLAVFLTIVIVLLIVIPSVLTLLFPTRGIDGMHTPEGWFSSAGLVNSTADNVFFGPFNRDVKPSEIMIIVENVTANQSSRYDMPANDLSGPLAARAGGDLTGVSSIVYADLAGDKNISEGDYITITYTYASPGSRFYRVMMVYVPTGGYVDGICIMWVPPHAV
jgi:hypothetical protein